MTEKKVTITNRAGIHARPAAMLVQTANQFASEIYIEKDSDRNLWLEAQEAVDYGLADEILDKSPEIDSGG